jgi:hypothetical protein
VFDKFPKYHMKILLGDFSAKVDKVDIFKWTIGNESLHEINHDNGLRSVNFATSKTSEWKVLCSHIATSINMGQRRDTTPRTNSTQQPPRINSTQQPSQ